MKKIILIILTVLISLGIFSGCKSTKKRNCLNLAGKWTVKLDPQNKGMSEKWFAQSYTETINLPGSTDEAGFGNKEKVKDPYNGLVRKHYYVGKAWYQREIEVPKSWKGKRFTLFLERCHWITNVWVDNKYAGSENSLCTAQKYDLTTLISPGKHTLTICVDNKCPFSLGQFSSSVSIHTQTNWNGIIGRIELIAKDPVYVGDLRVYPDIHKKQAKVICNVYNKTVKEVKGKLTLLANLKDNGQEAGSKEIDFTVKKGENTIETIIPMGDDVQLWDEFSPVLYKMKASLIANSYKDEKDVTFGMREIGIDNNIFTINGKRTYMRGNLECCIFPLTGYPPMTVSGWAKEFQKMKDYGLNHMRTHSWCPPRAAFEAADSLGIYIQAEGPRANVGLNPTRDAFIGKELLRMNKAYGNDPSLMFVTGGNELIVSDKNILLHALADDNRHFYSTSTGGRGISKNDQYRVAGGKNARSFEEPGTCEDRSMYYTASEVPCMAHEIGQFPTYPKLDDISKYTGVLEPLNLITIKNDLKEKGMLDLAKPFLKATVKQAAVLYKEEIEVLLRTESNAGFQMLSMQDYPGQGTAHVGLFNAFWENKGGITEKEFRKYCGPVTPLLRIKKRTYRSNETLVGNAEILNYGPGPINKAHVNWKINNSVGKVLAQGAFNVKDIPQGRRVTFGEFKTDLKFVKKAEKLTISLAIEGTDYLNDWNIWCYPTAKAKAWPKNIVVSNTLNSLSKETLAKGGRVLLLPTSKDLTAYCEGNPKTIHWSPTWPWSKPRGGNTSMSILCNPKHPIFNNFPTESYSNWQWWNLQKNSNSIILDTLSVKVDPIVRVIDNFGRNHKLGSLLEFKVGKGKLIICSMNIETMLNERPAAIQLRNSIIEYMESEKFNPEQKIGIEQIQRLFK